MTGNKESWEAQEEEDDCPWFQMSFDVEDILKPVRRSIVRMAGSALEGIRQFAQILLMECDGWLVPAQPDKGLESKEEPPGNEEHQPQMRNSVGQDSQDMPN